MSGTHTTTWSTVSDGEKTTLDPGAVVGEENVEITNSNIQWRGIETSETNTVEEYVTNTNFASVSGTAVEKEYKAVETAVGNTPSATFQPAPNAPTHTAFSIQVTVEAEPQPQLEDGDYIAGVNFIGVDSDDINYFSADVFKDSQTSGDSKTRYDETFYNTQDLVGTTKSVTDFNTRSGVDPSDITVTLTLTTYGNETYTDYEANTECATYPTVPTNCTFDRHIYNESINGGETTDRVVTSTKNIGAERCVTSDTQYESTLEMKTRGVKDVQETTYYESKNPGVSGDVYGDPVFYSPYTTLADGVTSDWSTLTENDHDLIQLTHGVDGSNTVEFRIEFTWEYTQPSEVATHKVQFGGETHPIKLVDPTSSQLQYNSVRTSVDPHGILAFDVVDPSDPNALSYYINHPTHGKLALRTQNSSIYEDSFEDGIGNWDGPANATVQQITNDPDVDGNFVLYSDETTVSYSRSAYNTRYTFNTNNFEVEVSFKTTETLWDNSNDDINGASLKLKDGSGNIVSLRLVRRANEFKPKIVKDGNIVDSSTFTYSVHEGDLVTVKIVSNSSGTQFYVDGVEQYATSTHFTTKHQFKPYLRWVEMHGWFDNFRFKKFD